MSFGTCRFNSCLGHSCKSLSDRHLRHSPSAPTHLKKPRLSLRVHLSGSTPGGGGIVGLLVKGSPTNQPPWDPDTWSDRVVDLAADVQVVEDILLGPPGDGTRKAEAVEAGRRRITHDLKIQLGLERVRWGKSGGGRYRSHRRDERLLIGTLRDWGG